MYQLLLIIIYISFISLGLPDALLGSAWPAAHLELSVPISNAGIISMIIAVGTIISSLQSDRLTKKLGTAKITAYSVLMTALALLGFSISKSFLALCIFAVPYGLGAGSVDAALNNYVALHYKSSHMSWLHCMWGLGAAAGPAIMGMVLAGGGSWRMGYRNVGLIQIVLSALLFASLPIWGKVKNGSRKDSEHAFSLKEVIHIKGAKEAMLIFFCYCAAEQTVILWSSSFLAFHYGLPKDSAAGLAGLFFIGITAGRALNGFLTLKFSDDRLILGGGLVAALGALMLWFGNIGAMIGLTLLGLGCAPVYPCMIHATPQRFSEKYSQALIGVQMASAYTGTSIMPPLFGALTKLAGLSQLPMYLLIIIAAMLLMHRRLIKS
ncbi:MAG: MFS transporter [Christensenellales bacterium]|jgi:fucose permease